MMTLEETIELMKSDDYKDRLKAEYWQTKIRLEKLITSFSDPEKRLHSGAALILLIQQRAVMERYLKILEARMKDEGIALEE